MHPPRPVARDPRRSGSRTFTPHRGLAVPLALALAVAAGCQGPPQQRSANEVGQTSAVVERPPFIAPHDPSMGSVPIVVAPIEVTASTRPGMGFVGEYVRDQFMSTLGSSPNFIVTDPGSYDEISRQMTLAESGATRPEDHPGVGQLVGARYVVKASLTELDESVIGEVRSQKAETGPIATFISVFLDGTIGMVLRIFGAANATVASEERMVRGVVGLEVRVTDVTTGAVVAVAQAQSTLTMDSRERMLSFAGIEQRDGSFEKTVVAQATRTAVEDAVVKIHTALSAGVRIASSAPSR